ncbi:site-specific integrase [Geobacter pelophilus]|uniref:Site-specific integrase n=2 Tax=Geoanaerobacter pelophilus TaxID=60036 RepID=A0AAW4LCY1_9BACT|nr:site-specific integrase [Geoanaerobacter pelophilus]
MEAILLSRRGKKYYCRVWVPEELREYLGNRKELKKSLRTTSRVEAKVAACALIGKAEQTFARLRCRVLTERELTIIAGELIAEFTGRLTDHRRNRKDAMDWLFNDAGLFPAIDTDIIDTALKSPKTPAEVVALSKYFTDQIDRLQAELATESYGRQTRLMAKQVIAEKQLAIKMPPAAWFHDPTNSPFSDVPEPPTDEELAVWNTAAPAELNEIIKTLLQAQIDAFTYAREQAEGKLNTPYQLEIGKRIEDSKHRPKLSELYAGFKQFKLSKKKWGIKSEKKYRAIFDEVIKILGDKEAAEYRSDDAVTLISELQQYNEPSTATGKVEFISSLYKFALKTPESQDRWKVRGNPFTEMQVAGKRDVENVPYSQDDLINLVTGLLAIRTMVEPHRLWVPLIALYSGMRQNEICQLRVDDIEQEGKVLVFRIRHNPALRQKTKNKKSRKCPVHPMLVKLGFLKFLETQKNNGSDRLFSTLSYSEGKDWTGRIRTWWNETYQVKYVEDTTEKSFHSMRKNFIDWFRQNKMYDKASDRAVIQSMVGHDRGKDVTGEHYETAFPSEVQYSMLKKLDYGFPVDLVARLAAKGRE